MGGEIEFLEYIYQNTKLGQENLARILKYIEKENEFSNELKEQLKYYRKIITSVKKMLETRGKKINDIGLFSKLATYMNIKINIKDIDDTNLVIDKVIKNSEVSIIDIEKKVSEYKIKSKVILNLVDRLINIEKNNINRLKDIKFQKVNT